MNKENCALKLVDEIILYYDARSKKHQSNASSSYIYIGTEIHPIGLSHGNGQRFELILCVYVYIYVCVYIDGILLDVLHEEFPNCDRQSKYNLI